MVYLHITIKELTSYFLLKKQLSSVALSIVSDAFLTLTVNLESRYSHATKHKIGFAKLRASLNSGRPSRYSI